MLTTNDALSALTSFLQRFEKEAKISFATSAGDSEAKMPSYLTIMVQKTYRTDSEGPQMLTLGILPVIRNGRAVLSMQLFEGEGDKTAAEIASWMSAEQSRRP